MLVPEALRGKGRKLQAFAAAFIAGVLFASTYSLPALEFARGVSSLYSGAFLFLLFATALPRYPWILGGPAVFLTLRTLNFVNEGKIAAVALPIMWSDVTTVVESPMDTANALGFHSRVTMVGLLLLLALGATIAVVLSGRRAILEVSKRRRWIDGPRPRLTILNITCLAMVATGAAASLDRYGAWVHRALLGPEAEGNQELWLPSAQVELARQIGVLEYVAFSFHAERYESDTKLAPLHEPLSTEKGRLKTREFDLLAPAPNVILFHAESSFDPNVAFRLSSRVDLPLWSKTDRTKALAPLQVNALGGGTWITEFEVLTGVDSRLFGYQGFYTHYYVAPKVKYSFVKYLTNRGYRAVAFYPARGTFYNTQTAFALYGFTNFVDAKRLGLSVDWQLTDSGIVQAVLADPDFKPNGPFLYFIETLENHGPHTCEHFVEPQQFKVTLVGSASFSQNCVLNEYLRRAASTSRAFELVVQRMQEIERTTGRPFVLLVYGDHQPYSFTAGRYSVAGGTAVDFFTTNLNDFRTPVDARQTFFHIVASGNGMDISSRFTHPVAASLLPTLLSAFLSHSDDDVYLPLNLAVYSACGGDIMSRDCRTEYRSLGAQLRASILTDIGHSIPSMP